MSEIKSSKIEKLDKHVSVHNIREGQKVGTVNYETSIREIGNLKSVSSKVVTYKPTDLISSSKLLKYFRKEPKKNKELKIEQQNESSTKGRISAARSSIEKIMGKIVWLINQAN